MGYPKNDLPLSPKRSFVRLSLGCAALLFLSLAPHPLWAEQRDDATALRLRANVVKVQSPAGESAESGFGFIIGSRDGKLYIVTADHVVRPVDAPNTSAPAAVKVVFYSDQGRTYRAELLETHDRASDLAVLRLSVPSGVDWFRDCLGDTNGVGRGTRVWFIGRNGNWFVPVQAGFVGTEHLSDDWHVQLESLPVRPGSSGGPLLSNSGIIGMIQRGSEDDSFALSIDRIKLLVRNWNYPWNLVNAHASTPTQTLSQESPTEKSTDVSDGSTPEREKKPAERKPDTANISLRYIGDYAGCVLQLDVKIGNKSFMPYSSFYQVTGVPTGEQKYTIRGKIQCTLAGWCNAFGSGTLDIEDSALYDVGWRNTGMGTCSVTLVRTQ
jgi:Trypsin-like peptidase domain